jgi:hypothetical protein
MVVMASIVDMHFTVSLEDFMVCRDREPIKWRQNAHLVAFADYFEMQWLQGHYWRWQAFHTPHGYATTNNPCENLNGALKSFLQRRRHHMRRLLLKLCDFVETIVPLQPAKSDYSPNPTTEIVQAAVAMTEMPDVVFKQSPDPNLVWVLA